MLTKLLLRVCNFFTALEFERHLNDINTGDEMFIVNMNDKHVNLHTTYASDDFLFKIETQGRHIKFVRTNSKGVYRHAIFPGWKLQVNFHNQGSAPALINDAGRLRIEYHQKT